MIIFFTGAFSYPCLSSSLTLYLFPHFLAISQISSTVSSRLVISLSPILTGTKGGKDGGRERGREGGSENHLFNCTTNIVLKLCTQIYSAVSQMIAITIYFCSINLYGHWSQLDCVLLLAAVPAHRNRLRIVLSSCRVDDPFSPERKEEKKALK